MVAAGANRWANQRLWLNQITVASPRVPAAFDGFRILQLSDLHNRRWGAGSAELLALSASAQPDIIVVTGDLVDHRTGPLDEVTAVLRGLQAIAPTYYVSGNHEMHVGRVRELTMLCQSLGVEYLDGRQVTLVRGDGQVILMGMPDPIAYGEYLYEFPRYSQHLDEQMSACPANAFTVLLAHRPELMPIYAQAGLDLVLAGHAHGGVLRIPGYGGLLAPGQPIPARYTGGLHRERDTQLVISRGAGGSTLRINNPPELVLIELRRTD